MTEADKEIQIIDAPMEERSDAQKEIDRLEKAKDKHYEDIRNLNDAIRMIQKNVELIEFILSDENMIRVEQLLNEVKKKKENTDDKLKSDPSL